MKRRRVRIRMATGAFLDFKFDLHAAKGADIESMLPRRAWRSWHPTILAVPMPSSPTVTSINLVNGMACMRQHILQPGNRIAKNTEHIHALSGTLFIIFGTDLPR